MKSKYIPRYIDQVLLDWKNQSDRKSLLLRGARQVGKSSAVRKLGESFSNFVEVNFERQPNLVKIFEKDCNPQRIIESLEIMMNEQITIGTTLLFFDEIQQCPQAIHSLRFFYEEMPELHLIAAGSLLEFALEEISSFGVGRIRSIFMFPMSLTEFLRASMGDKILNIIKNANPQKPLEDNFHQLLVDKVREYILIGGMPEAVVKWLNTKSFKECALVHNDIITTYIDDFSKYKKRIDSQLLRDTLKSVAEQIGQKFTFSEVNREMKSIMIRNALKLLQMASLIYPVRYTSGQDLPLGTSANDKYNKYLFIDSGLLLSLFNYQNSLTNYINNDILIRDVDELVNKGGLFEMIVGLELIQSLGCTIRPELYYWLRTERNSLAEVDYLIQKGHEIIPLEVKSGTKGGMKSMYYYLESHQQSLGIRTSLENFAQYQKDGKTVNVIPIYALSHWVQNYQLIIKN